MHFSSSVIGRSSGRSAAGAIAYRAAAWLKDVRTGEDFDYRRRKGVEDAIILAPEGAPDWVHDRQELWARVEESEVRKDAQLIREITITLPSELTEEQRRELVISFVRDQFVSLGMVADVAIHSADMRGGEENPHAHVALTLRRLNGYFFDAKKERAWNNHELMPRWRAAWAEAANEVLEANGHERRLDHRTLEDQQAMWIARAAEAVDEVQRLRFEAKAVALDYAPVPRLDARVWRAMKRNEVDLDDQPAIDRYHDALAAKAAAQRAAQVLFDRADELEAQEASDAAQAIEDEQRRIDDERLAKEEAIACAQDLEQAARIVAEFESIDSDATVLALLLHDADWDSQAFLADVLPAVQNPYDIREVRAAYAAGGEEAGNAVARGLLANRELLERSWQFEHASTFMAEEFAKPNQSWANVRKALKKSLFDLPVVKAIISAVTKLAELLGYERRSRPPESEPEQTQPETQKADDTSSGQTSAPVPTAKPDNDQGGMPGP